MLRTGGGSIRQILNIGILGMYGMALRGIRPVTADCLAICLCVVT